MSAKKTNITASGTEKVLKVAVPKAGAHKDIAIVPSTDKIALDFEPNEAVYEREGNNLVFSFANEGSVTLEDFFSADDAALPRFVLPEGVIVNAEKALTDLDLAPAASEITKSGLSSYAADPGKLIGGLELSGDLNSAAWGRDSGEAGIIQGEATSGLQGSELPPPSETGQTPPPVADTPSVKTGMPTPPSVNPEDYYEVKTGMPTPPSVNPEDYYEVKTGMPTPPSVNPEDYYEVKTGMPTPPSVNPEDYYEVKTGMPEPPFVNPEDYYEVKTGMPTPPSVNPEDYYEVKTGMPEPPSVNPEDYYEVKTGMPTPPSVNPEDYYEVKTGMPEPPFVNPEDYYEVKTGMPTPPSVNPEDYYEVKTGMPEPPFVNPDAPGHFTPVDLAVREHGLINHDATATDSGSFTVRSEAGVASVSFSLPGANGPLLVQAGHDASTDITENGVTYGSFTASLDDFGRVSYSFTLSSALDNDAPKPAFLEQLGPESGTIAVSVVATDSIGQESAAAPISLNIMDDAPDSSITFDDKYGFNDGVVAAGSTTTGVFTVNTGADGRPGELMAVNGVDIAADNTRVSIPGYGTLLVNLDGSFSFKALPDTTKALLDVPFTYTDADGDITSQVLQIGIKDSTLPDDFKAVAQPDEAGLAGIGSEEYTDKEFGKINVPEGWTVVGPGGKTVDYGEIVETEAGWSFKLNTRLEHTGAGRDTDTAAGLDKPTVIVQDEYGLQYEADLDVAVRDDILAVPDSKGEIMWQAGQDIDTTGLYQHGDRIVLANDDESLGGRVINSEFIQQHQNIGMTFSAEIVQYDKNGDMHIVTGQKVGQGETYYTATPGTININQDGIFLKDSYFDKTETSYGRQPSGGADRMNEINYDNFSGTSEAVVIDLDGIAFGVTLELSEFYGGKTDEQVESGRITYYLKNEDGGYEEVDHQDFSSSSPGGGFNQSFEHIAGGFDRIIISAKHNGVSRQTEDNSDFSIKSITFNTFEDFERYEHGTAASTPEVKGADGMMEGKVVFDQAMDGQTLNTNLGEITLDLNADGNRIVGLLPDGEKALEVVLTKSTGRWDYVQYEGFNLLDENGQATHEPVKFQFQVEDTEGDTSVSNIVISNLAPLSAANAEHLQPENASGENAWADGLHGDSGSGALMGGSGADPLVFYKGDGSDYIQGNGNELLKGGPGSGVMTGSDGADVFSLGKGDLDGGSDKITDFSIAQGDKIDLSSMFDSGANMDDLLASVSVNKVDAENNTVSFQVADSGGQADVSVGFQSGELQSFVDSYVTEHGDTSGLNDALMAIMIQGTTG